MNHTIEWHEECQKNSQHYLDKKLKELEQLKEEIKRIKNVVNFRQKQIDKAKEQCRTEFDGDKYLKKER